MSRRKGNYKREVTPDPVYKDLLVARFVNKIMFDGKKGLAQSHVYKSFDALKEKFPGEEPLNVFKKAVENIKPQLEVRSRRVGGATYQVPVDVRPSRRITLALRWLTNFSRKRGEKNMAARIAGEIVDAYSNRGSAIKKKEDVHAMAEANRAFSHYNW